MPDYFHLTPEALTMRFTSKSQVKASNLCNLVDDKLPDDLFVLEGDQLEIEEGDGTLNKDFALAIGFNQVFNQEAANQLGRLLIANGPGLDPYTILYYVRRLKNGPYGYGVQTHIKDSFIAARTAGVSSTPRQPGLGGGSLKPSFVDYLKNKLGALDCFLTPADYFDFRGVYGTLANTQNIWNYTTAPVSDTNNKITRGQEGYETASKMPKPLQVVTGALNLVTLGTYKKFLKIFKTESQLQQEAAQVESGTSNREENTGEVASQNITFPQAVQKASTDVLTEVAGFLGDAVRLLTFQKENPYGYVDSIVSPGNNAMTPQPPGSVGPKPKIPQAASTTRLNNNPIPPRPTSFTVTRLRRQENVNPNKTFNLESPTYEDFTNGKSQYVGVVVGNGVAYSGAMLEMENFKYNGKPVPLKVVGFAEGGDPSRIEVLTDPLNKSVPFDVTTGNVSIEPRSYAAQNCAPPDAMAVTTYGVGNLGKNISVNQLRQLYEQEAMSLGLVGRVPADGAAWGITNGSKQQWANFLLAVSKAESGYNPTTRFFEKSLGYYSEGLFQMSLGEHGLTSDNILDPVANTRAAIRRMVTLLDRDNRVNGGLSQYWSTVRPNNGSAARALKDIQYGSNN